MDYKKEIKDYLDLEIQVIRSLDLEEINTVMNVLEEGRKRECRVYICGNGGSAATASHFCCDFNKGISEFHDKRYDFICLSDNIPTMLATGNDRGYEEIFVLPIRNKIKPTDIFIGISGSGNSANVVKAMEYANEVGATTIAIVGYDGGKMKKIATHSIHANIDNMQISEDIHMILDHVMMWVLHNAE